MIPPRDRTATNNLQVIKLWNLVRTLYDTLFHHVGIINEMRWYSTSYRSGIDTKDRHRLSCWCHLSDSPDSMYVPATFLWIERNCHSALFPSPRDWLSYRKLKPCMHAMPNLESYIEKAREKHSDKSLDKTDQCMWWIVRYVPYLSTYQQTQQPATLNSHWRCVVASLIAFFQHNNNIITNLNQ